MIEQTSMRWPNSPTDDRNSKFQKRRRGPKWPDRLLIAFVLVVAGDVVQAQQPRTHMPRIGVVSESTRESLLQALNEIGYVDGKNVQFVFRQGRDRNQIQQSVVELVKLKVDVLVLTSQPGIRAAKQATKTIPIVMVTTQDPVAVGFIDSLARPGANITGVTTLQRELSGKRLEVLRETLPGISRVAALRNAASIGDFKMYEESARLLKMQLQSIGVQGPDVDLEKAFQIAVKERSGAMIAITNATINPLRKKIAALAIKKRLPLMAERVDYVEAGALMSYAADSDASYRRAAVYVDKILKGITPAELPVEQATKFELAINLKTATQIGLTIPPNVLARADKVIR